MNKSAKNEFDNELFDDSFLLANFVDSTFGDERSIHGNQSNKSNCLNISALCCDEEISGYDKLTGQTWIYPTNYPVRDYQFNIVKAALLKNTLVSLPTGLGKTFIAAVVMYNFYRWYPRGKIIFTAPTRPLVAQQIEACYNIVAIPPRDTIEMTGHMQINIRKDHWQSKRVFFATPQVIYNDIKSGICPGERIRCLVIDEAHKARGNYAYCQIVSTLTDMGHKTYRMLALSATPGSKVEDVISVVKSLHIAHLELRTENCIDVSKYSHSRKINTVIVQLGPELNELRRHYIEILDEYARRLKQFNILPQNIGNLSKGRVVMLYKEYQNKDRSARHPQHNYIMKDFTLLIALYHGLELLIKHGSRVFLNFFDDHPEKSWIQSDDRLTALLERLRDDLGVNPLSLDRSVLPDGTIPEIPKNLSFGHPKFYKLKEIMMQHFTQAKATGQDTRAIVFCEYRESVNLVHCLLLQCRPLILPQMFVGQGSSGRDGGVSQRGQAAVVRAFRGGGCNALVSTCVAEEGLDVGAVDLCVCFDVSTRSPIRLVQRCGRTGRARGGQVYILVTEGREHQTLLESMRQRDGLNKKILTSSEVQNNLYKLNPRMIPHDFEPECKKMFITVKEVPNDKDKEDKQKQKKGQKDLRAMLLGRPSTSATASSNLDDNCWITKADFNNLYPEGFSETNYFAKPVELWSKNIEDIKSMSETENSTLNLSSWLEWQRTSQQTINIGHSVDTEIFASLLKYSDAKRFDMPTTQNPISQIPYNPSQNILQSPVKTKPIKRKQQKLPVLKSPSKKDGDIRALFSTATKSTKSYTKLISDLGVQNDGSIPTTLLNLLVDLNLENINITKKCYVCLHICDCNILQKIRETRKLQPLLLSFSDKPKLPDLNLIDDIDIDMLLNSKKTNSVKDVSIAVDKEYQSKNDDENNCSKNFDLEFDLDILSASNSPKHAVEIIEPNNNLNNNFDIGDIEDIFAEDSLEKSHHNEKNEIDKDCNNPEEILGFLGLNSIDDIFADSDDDVPPSNSNNKPPVPQSSNKSSENNDQTNSNIEAALNKSSPSVSPPKSPSLLSGRIISQTSPILGSQLRKFQLSTKKHKTDSSTPTSTVKKQLLAEFDNHSAQTANISNNHRNADISDISNKSMLTITQLVEIINKDKDNNTSSKETTVSNKLVARNVGDFDRTRSPSPILLTQRDKTLSLNNNTKSSLIEMKQSCSLVVLDSDSDSMENTQEYELNDSKPIHNELTSENSCNGDKSQNKALLENHENETELTKQTLKRKFDESDCNSSVTASSYFNKKQKTDNYNSKPLSLQEKVLAALTSNTFNDNLDDNDKKVNFVLHSPTFSSQKENRNPLTINAEVKCNETNQNNLCTLETLQIFRRKSSKNQFDNGKFKTPILSKRKITFNNSDEDDDFVENNKTSRSQNNPSKILRVNHTANYKVRKKKKTGAEFLDQEAELTDDGNSGSGDELSDESAGSIIDFICDDEPTHCEKDMQAIYMRSVKSPVNGVFKIPTMPKKFDKEEIFSQYVEEDTYEMDSFCVDSHVGLTQANDMSELEIAEMILEEKKKRRRIPEKVQIPLKNDDSPIIKRKSKKVKNQIDSDSDDSS